ncbi:unnamed protein product [Linum trigynum]|uniref:TIR domain-containing protein n=1 Tax=Linum trigynum TaxID=586398 RepID=A0AAV2CHM4_9ROSI
MAAGGVVFICCCRELRSGFPEHLCAGLREAGLTAVMGGGDLPKGVNMRDAIRWAIEDSSFSVVILSREFASSQFRLDKVVHIKE